MLNPESYWVNFYPKCRGFSLAHKVFDESPEPKCVWKSVYANSCDVHFAGCAHKPPKPPDYTNCCADWYTLCESPKPSDHMVYATTNTKHLICNVKCILDLNYSDIRLFELSYYLSQEDQFDREDYEMNLLVFKIQGFYNYSMVQQSSWARYVNVCLKWLLTMYFGSSGFCDVGTTKEIVILLMRRKFLNGSQTQQNEGLQSNCIHVVATNPCPISTPVYQPQEKSKTWSICGLSNVETSTGWWVNTDAIHGKFLWVPLLLKTLLEKNDNHDQEDGVVNLTTAEVTCIVLATRLVGGVKVALVNPYVHHKILNEIWQSRQVAARASIEGQTVKKLSTMVLSVLLNFIIDKGFHLHYGETSCQIGCAYELRRCIKQIRTLDFSSPMFVNGEPLNLILASSYKVEGIHVGKWWCYGDVAGNRDKMKERNSLAYHIKGHLFASAVVKVVVTTVFKAILLVLKTLNLATSHIQNDMSVDALRLGLHTQNDMTIDVLVLGAGLFLTHYCAGLYALKIISDAVRVVLTELLTEPPTGEQLGWCTSWPDSYRLYGQEYELFLLCCVRQVRIVMSCAKTKSDSVVETGVWKVYTYELGNHKIINRLLPTTRKEEFKVISIKILMVHIHMWGDLSGLQKGSSSFYKVARSASKNELNDISREEYHDLQSLRTRIV